MAAPVPLRTDYDASTVRELAKQTRDANQARRLLTLAQIYDGAARGDAATLAGVGRQIVRDWVVAFNERGPDGLIDGKAPGKPAYLTPEQQAALSEIVEAGPTPAVHGVTRWRREDLAQWLWDQFGVSMTATSVGRYLKALGYRKLSARPRHRGQNPDDIATFKKTSRPRLPQ